MTATVALPADPEFSATARAIAAEQYRDDSHPFTRPAGQLWERTRDHHSFLAAVLTEAQWARMCAARNILGTRHDGNRQHDLVKPFTTDTMLNRAEAQGHLRRTGHDLTGFYVLQHGARGFYRLIRTCECAR